MKITLFLALVGAAVLVASRSVPEGLSDVDVMIGTDGHGYGFASLYPGPQVPFGMLRVSPDTSFGLDVVVPWTHNGGYHYGDTHVRFFSHTRMVGAGARDLGNLGVMPSMRPPSHLRIRTRDYIMSFSHDNEVAWPGYYSVLLGERDDEEPSGSPSRARINVKEDRSASASSSSKAPRALRDSIFAEVTANAYSAVHRYTFGVGDTRSKDGYIVIDLFHALSGLPTSVKNASIHVDVASQTVTGHLYNDGSFTGRFGGVNNYFVASFNTSFSSFSTWGDDAEPVASQPSAAGNSSHCGAFFHFKPADSHTILSVEMHVTLSWISQPQAQANLAPLSTTAGALKSFDQVATECEQQWLALLGTAQVSGGSQQNRTVFYTALYHAYQAPTQYAEQGGVYLGFDNDVHTIASDSEGYYSDMSIWDTHRTQFPWLTLFQPQVMQDIARSLLLMFEQGGDLPRWPMANGYTGSMIGQHADISLSDAAAKGLDFNLTTAYAGMYQGATEPQAHAGREDLPDYTTIGYVPYDYDEKGCPNTLAYAFDDWAVSNVAAMLGIQDDFDLFRSRASNWKTQLEPESLFMCPKTTDGVWECPPTWTNPFDNRYVEGDAWHYRFNVPHDGYALVQQYPSPEAFVDQLEIFFNSSLSWRFRNFLPNPYYWAGNEEDLHAAYMFHWAGAPAHSQRWVREMLVTKYTTDPLGIPGNDDYGTLSAWALWGYIGLYPLAGNNTYMVGSPVFDNTTITIQHTASKQPLRNVADDGTVKEYYRTSPSTTITVTAYNQSVANVYVQKASLNGEPLDTPFVQAQDLIGTDQTLIEVWLGPSPSSWGSH